MTPRGIVDLRHVTFTYDGADHPTLLDVDLAIPEGELCLVVGGTGSGKSTLLRAINGLVPRFTGGTLLGEVWVDGRRTEDLPPRELADVVGVVGQNPAAGFVTDTVEEELAYVMENLGVAPDAMRRRVEDVLDLLSLHELRSRPVTTLSGGQQQRVAIGAVLTASPRVLVLDEPTSALDPASAEEVLAALTRLVHDLGLTVVVAEHRLERVVPFADRVVHLRAPGHPVEVGTPAEVMATSTVAPPLVELGRLAGWDPLPLNVRDARRAAAGLRARLADRVPAGDLGRAVGRVAGGGDDAGAPLARVRDLAARYGPVEALRGVSFDVRAGEVLAVMGRNGAGKSTLLAHLVGLRAPSGGRIEVEGNPPHLLDARRGIRLVGLVPQDAGILLFHDSVAEECAAADRDGALVAGTTAAMLERVVPEVDRDRHPRDLSEGQRLGVALAVVLAAGPRLVLLDEPTRGLDYDAKHRLVEILTALAAEGHGVVLATHDVEVVAQVADRVLVLADGEAVADGPAREVVSQSPVFSPQVAKVLAPEPWLTVAEVSAALAAPPGSAPGVPVAGVPVADGDGGARP